MPDPSPSSQPLHPLDYPIWSALTTRQRDIAEGDGLVWRYPVAIAPFAAKLSFLSRPRSRIPARKSVQLKRLPKALRSRSAFTLNLISSPPLCSSNSHSTGTSTGAPLFLIKNTRNFAGLVRLAFRPTI
jgi:hypothetical protein